MIVLDSERIFFFVNLLVRNKLDQTKTETPSRMSCIAHGWLHDTTGGGQREYANGEQL